jgi:type VI secretion system protein ImpJ
VREIAWDYDALKAGKLRLEALSIIFRDGEIVDVAGQRRAAAAVDLSRIPPACWK